MKTLSIRIPDELHEALAKMAEQDRRSLNNFIIVVLEQFVHLAEKDQKED
jgi:predicted HicB family RNase H-like nuclease